MQVTALDTTGNSSKFFVTTDKGDFTIALSFTLKAKIWTLPDASAELVAAQDLAEAIVSGHDPKTPFRSLYVFAEHNTKSPVELAVKSISEHGYKG